MRIAVMIIGIALSLVMALQNLLVLLVGVAADNTDTAAAGFVSLFVAFLMFVAAAFAIGLPLVSTILFLGAGLFALVVSLAAGFGDLGLWSIALLILAAMAFIGWLGKRGDEQRAKKEREEHRDLLKRVAMASERSRTE